MLLQKYLVLLHTDFDLRKYHFFVGTIFKTIQRPRLFSMVVMCNMDYLSHFNNDKKYTIKIFVFVILRFYVKSVRLSHSFIAFKYIDRA